MGPRVNYRLSKVLEQSSIRNLFAKAHQRALGGAEVVDLTLGNPYGDPPRGFNQRLKSLATGKTDHKYMDNAGLEDVREEVAKNLVRRGLMEGITRSNVVMTVGASGAINCIFKAILNPGDEVIVLAPHFPDFPLHIENHGGKAVVIPMAPPAFRLDASVIERNLGERTKAIIINSPNNPTGVLYTQKEIIDLHEVLISYKKKYQREIYLISDEPYREIIFSDDTGYLSPAKDYPFSFMVYSFSKSLNIPGERIGYVVINRSMPDRPTILGLLAMSQRILGYTNAPALMQRVVMTLLDEKPDMMAYKRKKEILCKALNVAGYEYVKPDGAFYIFAKFPYTERKFLQSASDHNLFVVPGRAFGEDKYFRMAFSRDDAVLRKAGKILNKIRN